MDAVIISARNEHRVDLAHAAEALAANMSKLLRHEGSVVGNTVDGGRLWPSEDTITVDPESSDRDDPTALEPVDGVLAANLLMHLAGEFPEMRVIGDWREVTKENVDKGIVDTLGIVARRRAFLGNCDICKALAAEDDETNPEVRPRIRTQDVIDSLLSHRRHKRVRDSSSGTYTKHYARLEREFPYLPEDLSLILAYLGQFDGETGRTKRNQQDLLNMLYKHVVRFFGMARNPLEALERPQVTKKPISALSVDQVLALNETPQTAAERVVLDLLLGHGWRQVEVRRVLVADVSGIRDGMIWCRGKEREEWAPVLPEAEERLKSLAEGRDPAERAILSRRVRAGRIEPLGENGMRQMVGRLYSRAGIDGMMGHDLRRTFATLVAAASGDEILAMRLLRDRVPGQNDRYVRFSTGQLKQALGRYSPLRLVQEKEPGTRSTRVPGDDLVETGESRTPSHRTVVDLVRERRAVGVGFAR